MTTIKSTVVLIILPQTFTIKNWEVTLFFFIMYQIYIKIKNLIQYLKDLLINMMRYKQCTCTRKSYTISEKVLSFITQNNILIKLI